MLRINEAATRLGVTQTTLRRWEVQGRIHPVRTPGGERRYDEREIERLKSSRSAERVPRHRGPESLRSAEEGSGSETEYVTDDEPMPEESVESKPWDDAVHQAKASLQVRRIELERSELDRAALDATRRREEKSRNETMAEQEKQGRAKAAASEAQRLASLRQYGDMLAAMASAPTEFRAAVTRDLASYVTPAQFPVSAWAQSYEYVKARVERTLKPWRDEEAREQQRTERANVEKRDRRECESLIAYGMAHAERELASWDDEDAEEAREVIGEELRDEVGSDWTQRDVVELVDEILDEWE